MTNYYCDKHHTTWWSDKAVCPICDLEKRIERLECAWAVESAKQFNAQQAENKDVEHCGNCGSPVRITDHYCGSCGCPVIHLSDDKKESELEQICGRLLYAGMGYLSQAGNLYIKQQYAQEIRDLVKKKIEMESYAIPCEIMPRIWQVIDEL